MKARVVVHRGTPTIFVGDRPVHFGAVAYRNLPGQEARYHEHPHSFTDCRIPAAMALGICEVGDERALEQLADWFERYFAAHPDALAGCHLGLDAGADWVAKHPAEMTGYD